MLRWSAMALPFCLAFAFPPLVVWSAGQGGLWTLFPIGVIFGVLPIVDLAAGTPHPGEPEADDAAAFRAITWLWVPVHAAFTAWATRLAASGALSGMERVGLIASVGAVAGAVGITFAHELIHRSPRFERLLGDVLLALVTYPHFAVEHVFGHHRRVATPDDPATSRLGEGFWGFLPRALAGSLRHAWKLRPDRMRMYAVSTTLLYASVWSAWGAAGVGFFLAQSAVAVLLLEAINYVEHYGLVRRQLSPGSYEPVRPWHSWDSGHRVSNWVLINLARHADHHCSAARPFATLRLLPEAPRLPAGYGTMVVIALVPAAWRRVMAPRVAAARLLRRRPE
ncbi:MAG: alkane 1-monooxygenase [Elusimicrobia bacterium]|nr:alkane 1-monooxygenase [Elusimicrobiota bacterium]